MTAQNDSLLNNNEMIWLGESNLEYIFESDNEFILDYSTNNIEGITTNSSSEFIKIDLIGDDRKFISSMFENWVFDLLFNIDVDKFSVNEGLRLSVNEIDSILYQAPSLNKGEIIIRLGCHNEIHFKSYFIKQIWSFNKANNTLYLTPTEIVPVYERRGKKHKLCIIKLPNIEYQIDSINLHDEKYIWVKQHVDKISFTSCITSNNIDIDAFFENYLMNSNYFCQDFNFFSNSRCNHVKDSIYDFTFYNEQDRIKEESVAKVVIPYEDLKGIEIQQIWYLNIADNSLGSQLNIVSPLILYKFGPDGEEEIFRPIFSINN